jgi:hypothetical protein
MNEEMSVTCEVIKKFLKIILTATAKELQFNHGQPGIMVISVDIGSRLWEELEDKFMELDITRSKIEEERIERFMEAIKEIGLIGGYALSYYDQNLIVRIKRCFLAAASDMQIAEGLKYPLCPIGGLLVAGLHKKAHVLATLEKIERHPELDVSQLTFALYA